MGHPAREHREVGGDAPEPALEMGGVVVGEHPAHLVELAHDGLALEAAAPGGVPGAEDLDGVLQFVDLLRADGRRFVAVPARLLGVEGVALVRPVGREDGVGVEPVVHGGAEGGARGERGTRAHQAASVEHEVHSREFGEERGRLLGRPRHTVGVVDAPSGVRAPRAPAPDQAEILYGHDTAETLGEQGGHHPGHGVAGDLAHLDPAPYARGVGGQLGVAHGRRPPVHQSREFALGPAGHAEQVAKAGVGLSAHVKPPGSRLT